MTTIYDAKSNIRTFEGFNPTIGERVLIDPSSVVLGDLTIGDDVSIWPNCSIRADMHSIRIGDRSNIQDNSVLHITHASDYNPAGWPLTMVTMSPWATVPLFTAAHSAAAYWLAWVPSSWTAWWLKRTL